MARPRNLLELPVLSAHRRRCKTADTTNRSGACRSALSTTYRLAPSLYLEPERPTTTSRHSPTADTALGKSAVRQLACSILQASQLGLTRSADRDLEELTIVCS